MSLLSSGKSILACDISSITKLGIWIIINNKEYFIPFTLYPEFKNAELNKIFHVQLISPSQLHWNELDYDIEITALEQPEKFPLHFSN